MGCHHIRMVEGRDTVKAGIVEVDSWLLELGGTANDRSRTHCGDVGEPNGHVLTGVGDELKLVDGLRSAYPGRTIITGFVVGTIIR